MNSKFFFPTLLFLFFCSSTFAQTQKGNFVLSGKTGLNFLFSKITTGTDSIQTGKSNSREYDFTAGAAYFVVHNLSVGVSGTYSYNYSKIESGYITQNITESFTIVPQIQYYFPLEGKLKPTAAIGAGYVWLQQRDSRVSENYNRVYSISGPSFYGGVGLCYFIAKSLSFDLGFQYSYMKLKDKLNPEQTQKQNQFAGTMGISVFF
ncbi:MAG: outer membrane beta-barrel protein [Ginsengibacter sp.]